MFGLFEKKQTRYEVAETENCIDAAKLQRASSDWIRDLATTGHARDWPYLKSVFADNPPSTISELLNPGLISLEDLEKLEDDGYIRDHYHDLLVPYLEAGIDEDLEVIPANVQWALLHKSLTITEATYSTNAVDFTIRGRHLIYNRSGVLEVFTKDGDYSINGRYIISLKEVWSFGIQRGVVSINNEPLKLRRLLTSDEIADLTSLYTVIGGELNCSPCVRSTSSSTSSSATTNSSDDPLLYMAAGAVTGATFS